MIILRLLMIFLVFSQPACSQENDKPVLLLNPTVYTGGGEVYENAALAFESGKVVLLGDARLIRLDLSAYEVVEAFGLHVYPAALLEALPVSNHKALYYTPLDEGNYLLAAPEAETSLPVPVIREGANATFVITEEAIDKNEPQIRYIVVKGQLKRKDNVSLRRLPGDQ